MKENQRKSINHVSKINKKTIGKDFLLNINCMNFDDISKSTIFQDDKIQSLML
jgi:hypothetical protein